MRVTDKPATPQKQRLVIPFIIKRRNETAGRMSDLCLTLRRRVARLDYIDATPDDRDSHGTLWARMDDDPTGPPEFAHTHPIRQREAMENLRCQVCGKDADRNDDGYLFLGWRTRNDPETWPEGALTVQPPLCAPCAPIAVRLCPASKIFVPLRVANPKSWGVFGTLYAFAPIRWKRWDNIPYLPYGDERLDSMVASQLVCQLRDVKVVPLP